MVEEASGTVGRTDWPPVIRVFCCRTEALLESAVVPGIETTQRKAPDNRSGQVALT